MLLRRHEMPWRTAFEGYAAMAWFLGFSYFTYLAVFTELAPWYMFSIALCCLLVGAWRTVCALRILTLRASLNGKAMKTIGSSELRRLSRDPDQVWLGYGFEWQPMHAQRLYELTKVNFREFMVSTFVLKLLGYDVSPQSEREVGLPFIHGVEPREGLLYRPLSNFEGGTLILGTTQSGKGVLLTSLIAQAIYRGDVVIVLDPKNSKRLKTNVVKACEDAGRRPPLEFHPSFPERGVRLDSMFNWSRPTELASRIQAILPPNTDGAFAAFAWNACNTVVQGLVELEDRPNLVKLLHYVRGGIEGILEPMLERHFNKEVPSTWRKAVAPYLRAASDGKLKRPSETASDKLLAYVAYYEKELSTVKRHPVIDSQISVFRHNRDHYSKVTANLLPVLEALTSGPLGRSLSPDPFDTADTRPIMNLGKVVRGGHVLYIALDSLPDPTVASAIGALFLADLAALAGMRYNLGQQATPISLFVDEVSNVINQPLIEVLNKGAESGLRSTCAMQTLADLAKRLGSEEAARMAVGNLNNLFALRSKDRPTQEFIVETFGKTDIARVSVSYGTRFDDHIPDFSAGFTKSMSHTPEEIVPAHILGKLPNLQWFASVSGGRIIKGRSGIVVPAPHSEPVRTTA